MDKPYTLYTANNLDILSTLPDNSVDAIVCDPPYGIGFMNKSWDKPPEGFFYEQWVECYRVLKPGGHLLAFGATNTYDLLGYAIRRAGFEIRTQLVWLFSSGMPKGQNIGIACDKLAGAERDVVGEYDGRSKYDGHQRVERNQSEGTWADVSLVNFKKAVVTAPTTDAAKQWDGWNTGLAPAHEPICLARKPISEKTIVANVLRWGVGGLNIKKTRIPINPDNESRKPWLEPAIVNGTVYANKHENHITPLVSGIREREAGLGWAERLETGRYPKTVLIDDSDEVREMFPETKRGGAYPKQDVELKVDCYSGGWTRQIRHERIDLDECGSAARYFASFEFDDDDQPLPVGFYCGKVKPSERNAGLDGFELKEAPATARSKPAEGRESALGKPRSNGHPTVKPIKLMRWLCRLITPPNGTVLDPFMGSGSTGMAAMREGFKFIGIEMDTEYAAIARARIQYALDNPTDKKPDKKTDKKPFVFPDDLDLINPNPPKPTQQKLF